MPTTTPPTTTQRTGLIARSARLVNKLRPRSGYDVIAVIAMTAALGTGGAYAANMITGANVEDGSLTGIDIQDGSIKAVDLGTELSTKSVELLVGAGKYGNATVTCPAGKKAVGGGAESTGPNGGGMVFRSIPTSANDGWLVTASPVLNSQYVLTAFVQCARIA